MAQTPPERDSVSRSNVGTSIRLTLLRTRLATQAAPSHRLAPASAEGDCEEAQPY